MDQFTMQLGTWAELAEDAQSVREQVFIQEQQITAEDEWDAQDAVSLHLVAYASELSQDGRRQAIATARLLQNNSIGRVAVLKSHRGLGVGQAVMEALMVQAKQEQREYLKLSAQVHAISFYAHLGFQQQGETYLDCGIPHVDMYMRLSV